MAYINTKDATVQVRLSGTTPYNRVSDEGEGLGQLTYTDEPSTRQVPHPQVDAIMEDIGFANFSGTMVVDYNEHTDFMATPAVHLYDLIVEPEGNSSGKERFSFSAWLAIAMTVTPGQATVLTCTMTGEGDVTRATI